ncbi:hypothetical protein [Legionella cherrii]|uniref:Uncharacterized protein n=1 Tax=Legionella cherrii TaxID=28084 RepID=A0A0W0SGU4_9GAMM|nr:hypothetical protein [Legionella cherrii]KTC82656.1 hypothetical protein Lche_0336 [Legionella cherrii]VEB35175.1 Uncharacterised protein [Legionella cherrii]
MFEIFKNDQFVLYYKNENNSSGFTHLLQVKDLSTGKTTGMWIDPTGTSTCSNFLDKVLKLQSLKGSLDQEAYDHEVACFIERLIANGGYSSLQISSLMKDALKHHKNPQHVLDTIQNLDLSYLRHEDKERFQSIHEMRNEVAGFIKTLTDFVCKLLSIPSDVSVASLLTRFTIYQNPVPENDQEETTSEKSFSL